MPIAINGSGTVTGISVGGLPDGIVDTDMIAAGAVTAPKRGAGAILQVKQSVVTAISSYSTGSNTLADSFFDISGLSVTLTPSSGTKCLINYTVNIGGETGFDAGIAVKRDSTQIYLGDASSNRIRLSSYYFIAAGNETFGASGQFLDTHGADGSTAVTYKLQMYTGEAGRTTRVNRSHDDGDNRSSGRLASQITVMEVAA